MNGPPPEMQSATASNVIAINAMRDQRRECRSLYWRGWKLKQISDETGINYNTIAAWARRDKWDQASPVEIIEDRIEVRVASLIDGPLSEGDMKRADFCMRMLEKAARVRKFNGKEGRETDLNPNIERRNDEKANAKKAKKKNRLTFADIEKCRALFLGELYGHQRAWWDASGETIRFILKSRQIGATWYFAREAFMRAMDTGNNQIFLSASKNQAFVFLNYIREFVFLATGIELKGNPLIIQREDEDGNDLPPVNFHFLATNKNTAQSYHGDVYLDEVFWVPGFLNFEAVASAMASQKMYRITYFSTPSTVNHEANGKWTGAEWNEGRPKAQQHKFDLSHRALKSGKRGPDDIWRQIVTIDDAIAQGFDLFDRDALERRYSPERFANMYLCEFLDDMASAFPFALVGPCMVDAFHRFRDFSPAKVNVPGLRPFGNKSVWISIDPNNGGEDGAAIAVLAPPEVPGGKFRVLQKIIFNDGDFEGQDARLRKLAAMYNVTDMSVDISGGMGKAVFELIRKWFPTVRGILYTVASKQAMVIKGQNVMRNKRLEFDAGWSDVQAAFMSIRPAITNSGKQVTYVTGRTETSGHGDIAWAILQALSNEPMDASEPHGGGRVVIIQ